MKRYVICRMFAGSEEYRACGTGNHNWWTYIHPDSLWINPPKLEWVDWYGRDGEIYIREVTLTLGGIV